MIIHFFLLTSIASAEISASDAYCTQLSARSTEAEMYRSDPENYNAHWNELSKLQTAMLQHIEEEALEKHMSFEQYREHMKKRSKKLGKEINLSEFARAQYVSNLFQRLCVPVEAGVTAAVGKTLDGPAVKYFQPFETKALPTFTPFKTAPANSTK